jgi:hypothetical protein
VTHQPVADLTLLGTTVSGEKWDDGGGRPHLGFDGRGEPTACSRDVEPLFFKLGAGDGSLWGTSIQGEGWGALGTSAVLLDLVAELERLWFDATSAMALVLKRGSSGEAFIGEKFRHDV